MTELRRWQLGDAAALLAAVRGDDELSRQVGGPLESVAAASQRIDESLAAAYNFAITVDGAAVGNVGLSNVDDRHGTGWVSYWVSPAMRGRGLPTDGLCAVATWAFAELGLFRLELGHRVNNPASCRVATGAGFLVEGLERAKLRYGEERFDVENHARLRTDPVPARAALPLLP